MRWIDGRGRSGCRRRRCDVTSSLSQRTSFGLLPGALPAALPTTALPSICSQDRAGVMAAHGLAIESERGDRLAACPGELAVVAGLAFERFARRWHTTSRSLSFAGRVDRRRQLLCRSRPHGERGRKEQRDRNRQMAVCRHEPSWHGSMNRSSYHKKFNSPVTEQLNRPSGASSARAELQSGRHRLLQVLVDLVEEAGGREPLLVGADQEREVLGHEAGLDGVDA